MLHTNQALHYLHTRASHRDYYSMEGLASGKGWGKRATRRIAASCTKFYFAGSARALAHVWHQSTTLDHQIKMIKEIIIIRV